jgi:hypothetical protein
MRVSLKGNSAAVRYLLSDSRVLQKDLQQSFRAAFIRNLTNVILEFLKINSLTLHPTLVEDSCNAGMILT